MELQQVKNYEEFLSLHISIEWSDGNDTANVAGNVSEDQESSGVVRLDNTSDHTR